MSHAPVYSRCLNVMENALLDKSNSKKKQKKTADGQTINSPSRCSFSFFIFIQEFARTAQHKCKAQSVENFCKNTVDLPRTS